MAVAVGVAATAWAGFVTGDPDPFFGEAGKVTTEISEDRDDAANGLVALNSGKLIAAGETDPFGGDRDFVLVAYEPYGGLDAADFGNDGLRLTDFNGGNDDANAIALAPDGKLVVAGSAEVSPTNDSTSFAAARYKRNGKLDRTFSGNGRVTTRFGPNDDLDEAFGVVVGRAGKVTLAGSVERLNGVTVFALARFLENGRLDDAFDRDGRVTTRFPGSDIDAARSIAAAKKGKVVAAGFSEQTNGRAFALARYRKDGSLDAGFDGDGRVTTDLGNPSAAANAVLVQPDDGRIVAGGSVVADNGWAIARFQKDGDLDPSFNGTGFEIEVLGAGTERIQGLAIQGDGRIFAAGWSDSDFQAARFLADGGLDLSFVGNPLSPRGRVDFFGGFDGANAIVLQPPTDRPVLAGFATKTTGELDTDFALARFLAGN